MTVLVKPFGKVHVPLKKAFIEFQMIF